MKQATRCIEIIRKFSWSQRINGYGDMVISHLIDTALACGEITLDSVCHPIALKIREYDDKTVRIFWMYWPLTFIPACP